MGPLDSANEFPPARRVPASSSLIDLLFDQPATSARVPRARSALPPRLAGKLMTEAGAPWQQYDLSDSDADDAEARVWDRRPPSPPG